MTPPIMHKIIPATEPCPTSQLTDEVAKIAYTAIVQKLGTNVTEHRAHNIEFYANICAKVSFEFANAFMEERAKRLADQALKVKL